MSYSQSYIDSLKDQLKSLEEEFINEYEDLLVKPEKERLTRENELQEEEKREKEFIKKFKKEYLEKIKTLKEDLESLDEDEIPIEGYYYYQDIEELKKIKIEEIQKLEDEKKEVEQREKDLPKKYGIKIKKLEKELKEQYTPRQHAEQIKILVSKYNKKKSTLIQKINEAESSNYKEQQNQRLKNQLIESTKANEELHNTAMIKKHVTFA